MSYCKRVVTLLAVLAMVLTACAPGAAPSSTAPAAPAPTTAPAAAAPTVAPAPAKPTAAPAPAKLDKLNFAYASESAVYWPIFAGKRKGFYEKEGIDLDFVLVTGSPGQLQALVANAAQLSAIQVQAVITAIEKGTVNAHLLGNIVRALPYFVVGDKNVQTLAALKGKRFGVSATTGGDVALVKKVVATAGLKADDIEFIASGLPSARIAALRSGTLGGTLAIPPDDIPLKADGYPMLGLMSDVLGEFPFLSYTATDDFIKANPDLLLRFMRASYASTKWLFDPANKEEAGKYLAEKTKMDPKLAVGTYDFWVTGSVISKDMLLTEKAMKAVIDLAIEVGDIKAPAPDYKKYLDLSFVEKVTKQ